MFLGCSACSWGVRLFRNDGRPIEFGSRLKHESGYNGMEKQAESISSKENISVAELDMFLRLSRLANIYIDMEETIVIRNVP